MMIFQRFLGDHVLEAVGDGNLIRVSITTSMIMTNACVLKPQGVDGRLNLQHGEAKCQVQLPQSFMVDTNFDRMGEFTFGGISVTTKGTPNSTSKIRTPTSLLGVATIIVKHHFFFHNFGYVWFLTNNNVSFGGHIM
jgi:hypothetical protein